MNPLATVLQLFGLTLVVIGVWMYSIPAGIVLSGAFITLAGLALERAK